MNESPKALRLHIGLFGRRNAGKSSLLNALVGQDVAIVSPTPGSTADPVEKTLEMAPLGPVVFLDTAGLDDREASLGAQRVERSLRAMRRVDVALLVLDAPCWETVDADTAARLATAGIPFAVVVNSRGAADACDGAWRPDGLAATVPVLWASAREGWGLEGIRAALARLAPAGALKQPPLVHDLLPEHGTLLLVVPLDTGAPQGRLILPQVQTIRDSLDGRCLCLVVTEEQLPQAFAALRRPPDLVVCDSQVVHVAARLTPPSVPLTTFSILMARAKGDLVALAQRMFNVFEAVLPPHQHRDIEGIKTTLLQAGALGAAMSGSGPTVFGLFSQEAAARKAVAVLQEDYDEVYLTQPLPAHGASYQIPV